jgi:CheY-like chemotaxis protein
VPQGKASPRERVGAQVPDQPHTVPPPQRETVDRERLVLVAIPDGELAKQTAAALAERGLHTSVVHDGVEAMLEVQRQLPGVVVLSASLPKMYGFQVCEVMKRNESLRSIPVVLAGSIYHTDRYRREPNEFYGADAYLEDPDLPGGLIPILEKIGVPMTLAATPHSGPTSLAPPQPAPAPAAVSEPVPAPAASARTVPAPVTTSEPAATRGDDGLAEERAKAERLARIIVSDIILYNEDKFADALRRGCVVEAMSPDLEEGRGLFRDRTDERVREEQDHLVEELLRVARLRATG